MTIEAILINERKFKLAKGKSKQQEQLKLLMSAKAEGSNSLKLIYCMLEGLRAARSWVFIHGQAQDRPRQMLH